MAKTKPKKPRLSTNVTTPFGSVNRKVLQRLRDSYDPFVLLKARDAVDRVRSRDDGLRERVTVLLRMAMNLINDNYAAPDGSLPKEPIWELADRITGDLLESIAHLEKACAAVSPLAKLKPEPGASEAPDHWQA